MRKQMIFSLLILSFSAGSLQASGWQPVNKSKTTVKAPSELVILWTTAEKEVLTKMLYIYVPNAKKQKWFEKVTFIIWGPSAKLLAEDKEVQETIKMFKKAGVKLEACSWCTEQYGVTDKLKELGVDVKGMGVPLTKYLKDPGKEVVVF